MLVRIGAALALVPLLAAQEPTGKTPHPAVVELDKAFARAAERNTRVAVLCWGQPDTVLGQPHPDLEVLRRWWRRAELGGVPLRYEYELVVFNGGTGVLGQRLKTPIIEPAYPFVACAADGRVLGQRAVWPAGENPEGLALRTAWLEEHRVVMPDARKHLADALASAKKTDRRVLVHLGAPW